MGWDIIGDIHGHAERLEALLKRLGYRRRQGAWRHPDRLAIFLGDFIDRGPDQLATLHVVRSMMEAGAARSVMGNHEFNAIAWGTPQPDGGDYLRTRVGAKGRQNAKQHAAFLAAVEQDSALHRSWIEWFRQLPLWIEASCCRVVHACWSQRHVDRLRSLLTPELTLTDETVRDGAQKGSSTFAAIEVVLKGMEIELPPGVRFTDKDGIERHAMRTRWWDPQATTYRSAYIGPPGAALPDLPIAPAAVGRAPDKVTFFGHYWLDATDGLRPLGPRAACLDYSVARGGPLVAYRFDGEDQLRPEAFVAA